MFGMFTQILCEKLIGFEPPLHYKWTWLSVSMFLKTKQEWKGVSYLNSQSNIFNDIIIKLGLLYVNYMAL